MLIALLVAQGARLLLVEKTGEVVDVSFYPKGFSHLVILGPVFFGIAAGFRVGFRRPIAAAVLFGCLGSLLLAAIIVAMIGLGEGLGTLMTMRAPTTKISPLPEQITAVASGIAALFAASLVIWPEKPRPVLGETQTIAEE